MFRAPLASESQRLVDLGESTGLFDPGEAGDLLGGTLEAYHANTLPPEHRVVVWAESEGTAPDAWAYFAPTDKADGVWDLWWIGVHPSRHRQGIGRALLRHVESEVQQQGGRLLIIETSSTERTSGTRTFYTRQGYRQCGQIPDFYKAGDDKVIFVKHLT